ncbi:hypothetical protein CEXT_636131 [Caerostris extrusa]|uniref:Uncharacterized protein n=1 Tax=Caerostris extrusa TaxID=172846 RepID=A0AAV4V7M9_CAEEX|nr:hypothetical protein CEXT_636131 [Caerostris extrusa]
MPSSKKKTFLFNTSKDTFVSIKEARHSRLTSFFPHRLSFGNIRSLTSFGKLLNEMRACKSNLFPISDHLSVDSDVLCVGWWSSVLLHSWVSLE